MMNIFIANKKSKVESIKKKYPNASIFDITSKSEYPILQRLSPFYPHGNIPVPGMPKEKASCVEAVWQGLKVFEGCGVDLTVLHNDTMKNIKRTVKKFGKPLGHQYGDKILNYADARWKIYLPTFLYMLENVESVQESLRKIKERLQKKDVVFLDYNTNCNVSDYSKPLSHACLVKLYLEGKYPTSVNRAEYEAEGKKNIASYNNVDELIAAIEGHPKFNVKKHGDYIEKIKHMSKIDMTIIMKMNGKKKDAWKTIVNDIRQNKSGAVQLTLDFT
ncbi:MAG: hypothetical protein IJJ77_05630 [Paludibacteraceae bacterium]|nr:hypothetical protein [Paludibacteraceae bacterium]